MSNRQHKPVEADQARKDHLWPQIASLPYFRGLLRAVEARFYENIELPAPTLDLGCGDGHFASLAFPRRLEVGLDPWSGPLQEAHKRGVYEKTIESEASSIPYPDAYFSSAVSNSVLEHIPDVDAVVREAHRVLRPGGRFVLTVPSHLFPEMLFWSTFFRRVGLKRLGRAYGAWFNRHSRHYHCDSPEQWQYYLSSAALRAIDLAHYYGIPSLVWNKVFGRWNLARRGWNFVVPNAWLRRYYEEPTPAQGGYIFLLAAKRAESSEAGSLSIDIKPQRHGETRG